MMTHDFTILSTKIKSGLLASITLSHWIFISQILLQSNACTASLFFHGHASWTISNGPILQLCHVFSYTHAPLDFYIHILYAAQFLPFHQTFYTMDFPMSCQFYSLYKLSLMLVLAQHISLFQFALLNHFVPTISKISFYLFVQEFHEETVHKFYFRAICF